MKFISVDRVIRDICSSIHDYDAKLFIPMYRIFVRQFEYLDTYVKLTQPKHVITLSDTLTADMPEDCIVPIKVSYVGADKKLYPLGKTDDIYGDQTNKICQDPIELAEDTSDYPNQFLYDFDGYGERFDQRERYWVEGLWGYNEELNRLEFVQGTKAVAGAKLLVHYKSSNSNLAEIPKEMYQMVRSACLWHWYQPTNRPLSEQHRQELRMHERNYHDLQAVITPEDIIATIREEYSNVPR